jgi:hypothetical protein
MGQFGLVGASGTGGYGRKPTVGEGGNTRRPAPALEIRPSGIAAAERHRGCGQGHPARSASAFGRVARRVLEIPPTCLRARSCVISTGGQQG